MSFNYFCRYYEQQYQGEFLMYRNTQYDIEVILKLIFNEFLKFTIHLKHLIATIYFKDFMIALIWAMVFLRYKNPGKRCILEIFDIRWKALELFASKQRTENNDQYDYFFLIYLRRFRRKQKFATVVVPFAHAPSQFGQVEMFSWLTDVEK